MYDIKNGGHRIRLEGTIIKVLTSRCRATNQKAYIGLIPSLDAFWQEPTANEASVVYIQKISPLPLPEKLSLAVHPQYLSLFSSFLTSQLNMI